MVSIRAGNTLKSTFVLKCKLIKTTPTTSSKRVLGRLLLKALKNIKRYAESKNFELALEKESESWRTWRQRPRATRLDSVVVPKKSEPGQT